MMVDDGTLSDRAVGVLTVEAAGGSVPSRPETKTVFSCWRCNKVLRELPGDAHVVRDQVQCPGCGMLNALDYAFPLAKVEVV